MNRVTYRRRKSYNTRSNKIRKVKTPGGRLVAQYVRKTAKGVQTAVKTNSKLSGLPRYRNSQYKNLAQCKRTVARPYGGVLTPQDVKDKILRAFLIEEVKIVKQVVREQREANKPKVSKKKKTTKK